MRPLLLIIGCTDPLMWYAHLVGHTVPLVRDLPADGCWLSVEPAGLTNIVKHADAARVPDGYTRARPGTVMQQQDLIFEYGRWRAPCLEQLGATADGLLVVRKETS